MRVTGGTLGGRLLKTPKGDAVRPTQDKVRQALFSSFAASIPGCRFLDLFAGSGAVGLEAWSRGAAHVCWVESDDRVFGVLRGNVETLCGTSGEGCKTVKSDVFRFLTGGRETGLYDIVFADPPYDHRGTLQWATRLLEAVSEPSLLAEKGYFVMEQAVDEAEAVHFAWEVLSVKTYGGTRLTVYGRRGR
ncbi:MAG: 16S rRNA (guanine(966)-N(2))-methyltransferase RsmD [bacterium]